MCTAGPRIERASYLERRAAPPDNHRERKEWPVIDTRPDIHFGESDMYSALAACDVTHWRHLFAPDAQASQHPDGRQQIRMALTRALSRIFP